MFMNEQRNETKHKMKHRIGLTRQNLPIVFPTTSMNALPDRQSESAISSLANPKTRRLSKQLDESDCPDNNAISCSQQPKGNDLVIGDMDPIINWQYHTDDDDDEMMPEMEDEVNTTDTECELLECEPTFKLPEEEAPRKTRKKNERIADVATRRQKNRACKSSLKNYDIDFSDDAEI